MMGKSHAAMGLAVGAGIGVAVFGLGSSTWLISSVAVCGAAILPDIDEPESSVSREFGILSRGFSAVVSKISGGHRKLTHSLLGLVIATLVLLFLAAGREASAVIFGLLAASAWRIVFPWWLGLRRLFIPVGVVTGYIFYSSHPFSGPWLVAMVATGWVVHMLGDFLTNGGIPLLYPMRQRESWPIFGTTGSKSESIFALCLLVMTVAAIGFWFYHYPQGNLIVLPPHIVSGVS